MFDFYLYKKNDKYKLLDKDDLNIRKELCKPLFIQKLKWYIILALYFACIYFYEDIFVKFDYDFYKVILIDTGIIGIIYIANFFEIIKKSMYLYKLKIELDSDSKKFLYSKYVFDKWYVFFYQLLVVFSCVFYLQKVYFFIDVLIILMIINLLRILVKLGMNKFRLLMVKASLENIIDVYNEGDGEVDLTEYLEGGDELEIFFGTRYRAIVKELDKLLKRLEETTRKEKSSMFNKSQLVTNLSHDLKTPLTSVVNSIYILKNEELNEEEKKEQINILKEKSSRLKTLIDNLNEVINSQEDEIILNKEYLDIGELLRNSVESFGERLELANLDLRFKCEGGFIAYVDKDKTIRIFENLLNNIVKYSLEGTRVYIDVSMEDNLINLTFKNICKSELEVNKDTLGNRFVKGDKCRNSDGYGLGLSIVKNLVKIQGGKVNINTEGDLFKVSLLLKDYSN